MNIELGNWLDMDTHNGLLSMLRRLSLLRRLPSFLVPGAQKSGTTTLFHTLNKHPDINMSCHKEVNYFDANYEKSIYWYKSHFPYKFPLRAPHSGEVSPNYMIHPLVPRRIKETLSTVKLIFLLRNPVDRAYSQYQGEYNRGRESLTFPNAIKKEEERLKNEREKLQKDKHHDGSTYRLYSYLERGKYIKHLNNFLEYIPRERILLLKSSTFFTETEQAFENICDFLQIRNWVPDELPIWNEGRYQSQIDQKIKTELEAFFSSYNKRLKEKFGIEFS